MYKPVTLSETDARCVSMHRAEPFRIPMISRLHDSAVQVVSHLGFLLSIRVPITIFYSQVVFTGKQPSVSIVSQNNVVAWKHSRCIRYPSSFKVPLIPAQVSTVKQIFLAAGFPSSALRLKKTKQMICPYNKTSSKLINPSRPYNTCRNIRCAQ
jgi:hypothetical protein